VKVKGWISWSVNEHEEYVIDGGILEQGAWNAGRLVEGKE
jgi:hypothetical protein